jgi:hypothetical protein
MGMRNRTKWRQYLFIAVLAAWPLYSLFSAAAGSHGKEDAAKLLFQVAQFQMEVLGSYMVDMDQKKSTGDLDALKQALYSAQFTHERLVLAIGEESLGQMDSLKQLQQTILRMQIGSVRPLKPEELQLFAEVKPHFAQMFEAYGKLWSSGSAMVPSQQKKLAEEDKALALLLKKKLAAM